MVKISDITTIRKKIKRRIRNKGPILSRNNPNIMRTMTAMTTRPRKRRSRKIGQKAPKISNDGLSFLKCAYAPPDFSVEKLAGIPDTFTGRTLIKRHKMVNHVNLVSGRDYFFLVAPVPGQAYYFGQTSPGGVWSLADNLVGVPYADLTGLFGPAAVNSADIVNGFRHISLCAELIPTTNAMTWTGSVEVWKMPLGLADSQATSYHKTITGLQGLNATNNDRYIGPFNAGAYSYSTNQQPDVEFSPIIEGYADMPVTTPTAGTGDFVQLQGRFPGLGGMEAILIKVSGVTADQSCIIKTWACVEYKVAPNSVLYEYSSASPAHDPLALELYSRIATELPIAVPYYDNDNFWQRIVRIIQAATGVGAMLPGNYGMVSRGANLLASATRSIFSF